MILKFGNEQIEVMIEYRKRKSIEIRIEPPGIVKVRVPKGVKEELILESLEKKKEWIFSKVHLVKSRHSKKVVRGFTDDSYALFLGTEYPVKTIIDHTIKTPIIDIQNDKLIVKTPIYDEFMLKIALENWYRKKALELIISRVEFYEIIVGVSSKVIKIKEQKKRWGSCTSDGKLLFNWRCIMAPIEVLDYVIVHEVCHLIHLNHSKDYWKLVGTIMPDYKMRKEWLKQNSVNMSL